MTTCHAPTCPLSARVSVHVRTRATDSHRLLLNACRCMGGITQSILLLEIRRTVRAGIMIYVPGCCRPSVYRHASGMLRRGAAARHQQKPTRKRLSLYRWCREGRGSACSIFSVVDVKRAKKGSLSSLNSHGPPRLGFLRPGRSAGALVRSHPPLLQAY
jgi:hypothetical protein